MPLLIVLGLLVGCGVYGIAESSKPQAKPNAERFFANIVRRAKSGITDNSIVITCPCLLWHNKENQTTESAY